MGCKMFLIEFSLWLKINKKDVSTKIAWSSSAAKLFIANEDHSILVETCFSFIFSQRQHSSKNILTMPGYNCWIFNRIWMGCTWFPFILCHLHTQRRTVDIRPDIRTRRISVQYTIIASARRCNTHYLHTGREVLCRHHAAKRSCYNVRTDPT